MPVTVPVSLASGETMNTYSHDDLDPALAHVIEETILFGGIPEIDELLERVADDVRVPDELRYGLESLRYFRAHYSDEKARLSNTSRHSVIKMDADWTMKLIQQVHSRHFGVVEEKLA